MSPPADIRPVGHLDFRDRVWSQIRQRQSFFVSELDYLADQAGLKRPAVAEYVRELERAGVLAAERQGISGPNRYSLRQDVGVDRPRIRAGQVQAQATTARERMWRAMPALREFGPVELAAVASVDEVDARDYLGRLHRAGYLAVTQAPSNAGGRSRYRVIRYTGPRPPAVRRDGTVYDRNTGQTWGGRDE